MSATVNCMIMALIICGAIAGTGHLAKTPRDILTEQNHYPVTLSNTASDAEVLFRARYAVAHDTAMENKRPLAQPYDICQACILHCGGTAIPAEQCMTPCSKACGLDVPEAMSVAMQHGER